MKRVPAFIGTPDTVSVDERLEDDPGNGIALRIPWPKMDPVPASASKSYIVASLYSVNRTEIK